MEENSLSLVLVPSSFYVNNRIGVFKMKNQKPSYYWQNFTSLVIASLLFILIFTSCEDIGFDFN